MKLANKKFPFWAIKVYPNTAWSIKFIAWRIKDTAVSTNGAFVADKMISVSVYTNAIGLRGGWCHMAENIREIFHKSTVYKMVEPEMRYKTAIIVSLFSKI